MGNERLIMDTKLLQILDNREQNYPHALEKQYRRVLNRIMELWDKPEIEDYFNELLVSKRSDRQGFPPQVASDIIYLSMVHSRQRSREQVNLDPWGNVLEVAKKEIERLGVEFSKKGLIRAGETGNTEAIILFLKSGMDIDTCDERQWTLLTIAAYNGNEKMVALLIDKGANIHHRDSAGYTSLHWAALNGHEKVVRLLLENNANVNACSRHGWTALLQAATRGQLPVCQALIEYGAHVNAVSSDGWTALHKAVANGHSAVVKLLISKGADAGIKCGNGMTTLDLAKKNKHEQIVAILSGKK